jgi:hypothetical protein
MQGRHERISPILFAICKQCFMKRKKEKNEENLLRGAVINAGSLTLTDDRLNIVTRKVKKFLLEKLS